MKNIHLDNIVKNFIDNLEVEKPIYEMEADDARRFLAEVQEKDYENLEGFVEDISIFSPIVGDISVRLVKPEEYKTEILPLVIYCHGGGYGRCRHL